MRPTSMDGDDSLALFLVLRTLSLTHCLSLTTTLSAPPLFSSPSPQTHRITFQSSLSISLSNASGTRLSIPSPSHSHVVACAHKSRFRTALHEVTRLAPPACYYTHKAAVKYLSAFSCCPWLGAATCTDVDLSDMPSCVNAAAHTKPRSTCQIQKGEDASCGRGCEKVSWTEAGGEREVTGNDESEQEWDNAATDCDAVRYWQTVRRVVSLLLKVRGKSLLRYFVGKRRARDTGGRAAMCLCVCACVGLVKRERQVFMCMKARLRLQEAQPWRIAD